MGIENYLILNNIAFLKFIIKVSGMILGIISFLVFIGAVACFIQKDMAIGMVVLLLEFLISPYRLPKIALWITAYLKVAKDTFIALRKQGLMPIAMD